MSREDNKPLIIIEKENKKKKTLEITKPIHIFTPVDFRSIEEDKILFEMDDINEERHVKLINFILKNNEIENFEIEIGSTGGRSLEIKNTGKNIKIPKYNETEQTWYQEDRFIYETTIKKDGRIFNNLNVDYLNIIDDNIYYKEKSSRVNNEIKCKNNLITIYIRNGILIEKYRVNEKWKATKRALQEKNKKDGRSKNSKIAQLKRGFAEKKKSAFDSDITMAVSISITMDFNNKKVIIEMIGSDDLIRNSLMEMSKSIDFIDIKINKTLKENKRDELGCRIVEVEEEKVEEEKGIEMKENETEQKDMEIIMNESDEKCKKMEIEEERIETRKDDEEILKDFKILEKEEIDKLGLKEKIEYYKNLEKYKKFK